MIKKHLKANTNYLYIHDTRNNLKYYENSVDFWFKRRYDIYGVIIYLEYSSGLIVDDTPLTNDPR